MIDPATAPAMAAEISVSTFGPVQQLGARLGQILGSELSRMRADAAFAEITGNAVHGPAMQADTLRAQHTSVLGNVMLGLSTQTDFHADNARSFADDVRRGHEHVHDRSRREGDSRGNDSANGRDSDDSSYNADEQELFRPAFAGALRQSLLQFRDMAAEAGYSGSPVVVALPARPWLEEHAPADSRVRGASEEMIEVVDALVLCLAFDGSLGEQRIVMGLLFRADSWVGTLEANWSPGSGEAMTQGCAVHTMETASMMSEVNAVETGVQDSFRNSEKLVEPIHGIRVKIEDTPAELEHWCWQATQWRWH